MVHRPDWMKAPVDEDILYQIDQHGNLNPQVLEEYTDFKADWISKRCQVLVDKGLLVQLGRGLFGITPLGEQWVRREIDLDELADKIED